MQDFDGQVVQVRDVDWEPFILPPGALLKGSDGKFDRQIFLIILMKIILSSYYKPGFVVDLEGTKFNKFGEIIL